MMRRRLLPVAMLLVVGAPGTCQTGTGSAVCASCHSEIARSYQTTPMARSARTLDPSAVPERLDRASFLHSPSGFRYRVSLTNSAYSLEFSKTTAGVNASKPLSYAIGSGTRAFSYLIEEDGFLYEAPVAYYAAGNTWGLAPGYDGYTYPYLTRPALPGCLSCHASSLQPVARTLNRYKSPAFLEGGVACERCHGDGAKHVAQMKSGGPAADPRILNPAKLAPERRDSICAQCHLTGDARVMRPGSDWQSFKPGGSLNDYQTVFVRSPVSAGIKVTGHVENLALSACKRKAGDRLWCGSCHDPHFVPGPLQAKAWFRERCLACHSTKPCSESQSARLKTQDDCVGCHMPRSRASDAQHVVLTDHTIPRRPRRSAAIPSDSSDAELAPFGGMQSSQRDLALAYGIAAIGRKNGSDRARAFNLLEKVAKQAPSDVEVLLFLAEIYRNDGKNDLARPLYERAIALDPGQVTASVGLGGIMMETGEYREAVRLWNDALSKNAGLELVRLNLSLALLQLGDRAAAETKLKQALNLNPAFTPARDLLQKLSRSPY
jgi:predicted CXXCH cytochrome family protein